MKKTKWSALAALGMSAALLSACGGGGSSTTSTPSAPPSAGAFEGGYAGAITGGSASTMFQMVVLEDASFWNIYGTQGHDGIFYVAGLIQGNGRVNGASLSSTDLRDFGYVPAASGQLSASVGTGGSLGGSVTFGDRTASFTATRLPVLGYDYNARPDLSQLTGTWVLGATDASVTTVNIASDGRFSGLSSAGCSVSGRLAARASGKNVFDATVNFGPAPCALPNGSARGIAISALTGDGTIRQVLIGITNADRTLGLALIGAR